MSDTVRVLVADDHPVYRDGMRAILQTAEGIEVVGEATDGAEAVEQARSLTPDVVVMDLNMPHRNGVEATRELVGEDGPAVLVLTMLEDDDSVFAAMRAGASGYLLKGADDREIIRAILAVAAGEVIFGAAVARRVMDFFTAGTQIRAPSPFPQLTTREAEVLSLVARAATNRAIAARLGISEKTVRNHVSTIFMKLRVADRAEAIVKAREAGLT